MSRELSFNLPKQIRGPHGGKETALEQRESSIGPARLKLLSETDQTVERKCQVLRLQFHKGEIIRTPVP